MTIRGYQTPPHEIEAPQLEPGDSWRLVLYGIASFIYRMLVTVSIVLFIAQFEDVYAELPWNLREQRDELAKLPPAPTHN